MGPVSPIPIPNPVPAIKVGSQIAAWATRRLRRDHGSLYGGWYTQNYGNRRNFYLSAACAPSRRFRKARRVSPGRAHAFLDEVFAEKFDSTPSQSLRDVVAFEVPVDVEWSDPDRAVRINANGRVEIFWRVAHERGPRDELVLPIVAVMRPLHEFAIGVSGGAYKRLYELPSRARRLDWFVAVSPYISTDAGSIGWDDLHFPGVRPRLRASRGQAPVSPRGLAPDALGSVKQRTRPRDLVALVLEDLLTAGQWDGNEEAIIQTLDALDRS
jgi:hypothetical protein